MPRLLFEKTGRSVWMSHLDTMRLFQRAFKRAGLNLKHTQGFNPRPSVSIALPLSVGVESRCELLDFDLEGESVPCAQLRDRLNGALVEGIRVRLVYENGGKLRELALLESTLTLEYDAGIPEDAQAGIAALFQRESVTVEKKSKNGPVEQDIIPMLRSVAVRQGDGHTLCLTAVGCCQNPTLNPMQLAAAVEKYLPQWKPDHVVCRREEIYDHNGNIFR